MPLTFDQFQTNMQSTIENKKRKQKQSVSSVPAPLSIPLIPCMQVDSPQLPLQNLETFENIFDFNAGSYADDIDYQSVSVLADQSKFVLSTVPNSNSEKSVTPPYKSENIQLSKGDLETTIQSYSKFQSRPSQSSTQHYFNVLNSKEYIQQANSHKNNPFRSYQSDSDVEPEPEPSESYHRFRSG
jgi:hypothetical protein